MTKVKFGNFNLMGTCWAKFLWFSMSFCQNLIEFRVLGFTKSNLGLFRVFKVFAVSTRHPVFRIYKVLFYVLDHFLQI